MDWRTRRTGTGSLRERHPNFSSFVSALHETLTNITQQRSCTHSAPLKEGFHLLVEPDKLDLFSNIYDCEKALYKLICQGRALPAYFFQLVPPQVYLASYCNDLLNVAKHKHLSHYPT